MSRGILGSHLLKSMVAVELQQVGCTNLTPMSLLLLNIGSDVQCETCICSRCVIWMESLFHSERDVDCLLKGKNDPKLSVLKRQRETGQYRSILKGVCPSLEMKTLKMLCNLYCLLFILHGVSCIIHCLLLSLLRL